MPAYLLFVREGGIRDQSAMDAYGAMIRKAPPVPSLKPLVVYGKIEALEGDAPDGVVLLQFPSAEDAMAWYNSPDYQAAIPYRKKAADYSAMLIHGL